MKQIIKTSFNFKTLEQLYNYMPLLLDYCLPAIKAQTNQNFIWNLWHNKAHTKYIESKVDFPFINCGLELKEKRLIAQTRHPHFWEEPEKYSIGGYTKYIKENNINIQTKLDCDDWIAPGYVEYIQKKYGKEKDNYNTFIINSQPEMLVLKTGKKYTMNRWSETNISMIYSLCAKNYDGVYLEKDIHDQMFKYVDKVFMMPEKMTRYIVHGNNFYANTEERLKGLTWDGKL